MPNEPRCYATLLLNYAGWECYLTCHRLHGHTGKHEGTVNSPTGLGIFTHRGRSFQPIRWVSKAEAGPLKVGEDA